MADDPRSVSTAPPPSEGEYKNLVEEGPVKAREHSSPDKPSLFSSIGQHAEGLGGSVAGGLGSLLGAIGLPGIQQRVSDWSENSSNKKLLGGGTAVAGTLLTALLARKLLGSGGEQRPEPNYGPMYHEAGAAYRLGYGVGLVKLGYPQSMGTPIKPLKGDESKTATPRRWGIHGSNRQRSHDKMKRMRLASVSALGR